jgi:hypothetical protein
VPRKVFVAGEILTAADVNANLMDQAVMVFDDAAARTAAIPSPIEGMVTYLKDTDALEKYTTDWVSAAPQKVLQVVQDIKTDTETISTGTFTAVSGLSAAITPSSASNKVLITVVVYAGGSDSGATVSFRLTGGNSGTFIGDAGSGSQQRVAGVTFTGSGSTSFQEVLVISYLDSPNTISAVTYGLEWNRGSSGTAYIGRTVANSDNADNSRTAASITVMEVAG